MSRKVYESIGSGQHDDWLERERRYEAKHSPWALDDNAAYLDEEHRRHCEAREARREHEINCEVPRPANRQVRSTELKKKISSQWQPIGNTSSEQVKPEEESIVRTIIIIVVMIVMIIQMFFG